MSAVTDVAEEVGELCRRVLGPGTAAEEASRRALERGIDGDRLGALRRAVKECRRAGDGVRVEPTSAPPESGLREAVAAELAAANSELPERQREVLALRELFRLSHEEIAGVMGIEPVAVAALVARARLLLRARLRGEPAAGGGCPEPERALPALARRLDGEEGKPGEGDWIRDHMEACAACERAHAMMLEASACYRGWSSG